MRWHGKAMHGQGQLIDIYPNVLLCPITNKAVAFISRDDNGGHQMYAVRPADCYIYLPYVLVDVTRYILS